MASSPASLRTLYRSLLRELPPRPILAAPRSQLHDRIRSSFASPSSPSPDSDSDSAAAQQLVTYLRSQRMYVALVERYNPGMDMPQDERIRLTARRVGMNLPLLSKDGGAAA